MRLTLDSHPIPIQNSARFLVLFYRRLNWKDHKDQLKNRCQRVPFQHYWGGMGSGRKSLLKIYKALVRSEVDYESTVNGSGLERFGC